MSVSSMPTMITQARSYTFWAKVRQAVPEPAAA
jgi:hypothetical protein